MRASRCGNDAAGGGGDARVAPRGVKVESICPADVYPSHGHIRDASATLLTHVNDRGQRPLLTVTSADCFYVTRYGGDGPRGTLSVPRHPIYTRHRRNRPRVLSLNTDENLTLPRFIKLFGF